MTTPPFLSPFRFIIASVLCVLFTTSTLPAQQVRTTGTLAPGAQAGGAEPTAQQVRSTKTTAATVDQDEVVVMSEFEVRTDRDTEYRARNTASANRFNTDLMDTPQEITILTEQFLRDFETLDMNEALLFVPGVMSEGMAGGNTSGSSVEQMMIRGFVADNPLMGNIAQLSDEGGIRQDPVLIDRVEVLKGSSSSLYGDSSPGGMINVNPIKPGGKPRYRFKTMFGSYNLFRQEVDLRAPLTRNKRLNYRVAFAYEQRDSFRDHVNGDSLTFSPMLSYQFRPGTSLTVKHEYRFTRDTSDMGLPVISARGENTVTLPRERFLNLPDLDHVARRRITTASLDHSFSSAWSLRAAGSYQSLDTDRRTGQMHTLPDVDGMAPRRINRTVNDNNMRLGQLDVVGKFHTWNVRHHILFGADYRRTNTNIFNVQQSINPQTVDVDNPSYEWDYFWDGTYTPTSGAPNIIRYDSIKAEERGYYVQEQAFFLDGRLQFVAGLRFDDFDLAGTRNGEEVNGKFIRSSKLVVDRDNFNNNPVHYDMVYPPDEGLDRVTKSHGQTALSPRYSLVYRPDQAVMFYAAYGKSFKPDRSGRHKATEIELAYRDSAGRDYYRVVATDFVDPERSTLKELGVKTQFFGGDLSVDFAVYDLLRYNVISTDPLSNNNRFIEFDESLYVQIGEERTRGFTVTFATRPIRGLNLYCSYTNAVAKITEDTTNVNNGNNWAGRWLRGNPRHAVNAHANYKIQGGLLKGLGLGARMRWTSLIHGNPRNQDVRTYPGYALMDANVSYGWKGITFNVAVINVFDKLYWANPGATNGNKAGAPRTIRASVERAF